MAKNNQIETTHKSFEDIKRLNRYNEEFWMARELAKTLDYAEFRNFSPVIEKAKKACKNSEQTVSDHFVEMHEMVDLGSGAQRKVASYALSRYACYLIVQNADANKLVIANGQTYFAIQTRRQELKDDTGFQQLSEDQKRLMLHNELATHNKQLAAVARNAGVKSGLDYAIFQNHGYKGLYGGLDNKAIHQHKGLKKSQKILDHMGSTELAANLFRATQTEDKLKRDAIKGKSKANQTHRKVGAKVRQTIKELGGTMPEDLPTPEQGIKQLEHQRKKLGNGQE
ncbi:MAG: DNA damage-inducible protein D [Gammaproteobacteria bacterium]|nr:DNA damage-inducible protein D [Gammaproteobacteria bacterium]MCF6260391.1 DNA damage-inducible protein D [Gammaproteobacteria bacterium]